MEQVQGDYGFLHLLGRDFHKKTGRLIIRPPACCSSITNFNHFYQSDDDNSKSIFLHPYPIIFILLRPRFKDTVFTISSSTQSSGVHSIIVVTCPSPSTWTILTVPSDKLSFILNICLLPQQSYLCHNIPF